jgi:hypothetical protein
VGIRELCCQIFHSAASSSQQWLDVPALAVHSDVVRRAQESDIGKQALLKILSRVNSKRE